MEKKIDKDNLINQLYDYLIDEVRQLNYTKDVLRRELNQMKEDKDKKMNAAVDQNRIYRIRKVFSPLDFSEDEISNASVDTSELDASIRKKSLKIQEIERKIKMLSGYLDGLEANYFIVDTEYELNDDEKIEFVPAFQKLMEHMKMIHPEVRMNYDILDQTSDICMSFSFLKGFQELMKYLIFETGVYVINLEQYIDKYKILIQFHGKPKIPKDIEAFRSSKKILEDKLTKEFSIIRWKSNSIIIQALMEI